MQTRRIAATIGVLVAMAQSAGASQWVTKAPMANGARAGVAVVAHDGKIYALGNGVECEVYDPGGDSWQALDDLPFSCHQGRAVSDGTHIYLIGGEDRSTNHSTAHLYRLDPTAGAGTQWLALTGMSTPREGHGAALVGGTIYVFGGLSDLGAGDTILSSVEAYDIAGDTWSTKTPVPYVAGFGVTATAIAGKVYVIGGISAFAAGGWHGKASVFDPSGNFGTGSFTTLADMPVAKTLHGSAAVNGSILVSGGMTEVVLAPGAQAVDSVEAYDPVNDTWTTGPDLPATRSIHDSCGDDGVVYVVGGQDDAATTSATCYAYVAGNANWMPIPPLPTGARIGIAVAAHEAKVYALGGDNQTHSNVYDPALGSWDVRDDVPYQSHHARAVSDGSYIYIMGGTDGGTALDTKVLWRFDPDAATGAQWTQLASMAKERHAHAAVCVSGSVYVFGGQDDTAAIDSVEAYDIGSDQWSAMASLPSAAMALTAAVISDEIYVFGGGAGATALSDAYLFDPAGDAGNGTYTAVASMPEGSVYSATAVAHDRAYVTGGVTLAALAVTTVTVYDPAFDSWTTGPVLPFARRIHGSCSINDAVYVITGEDGAAITDTCYVHVADATLDTDPTTPASTGGSDGDGCTPASTSAPWQWLLLTACVAALLAGRPRGIESSRI